MPENKQKSYVINIDVTLRDGGFFTLNSYDLPGLCLLGKDPIRLMRQVPELVKTLFKLNFGQNVIVRPASRPVFSGLKPENLEQAKTWTATEEAVA